jgi:hypothetical protein
MKDIVLVTLAIDADTGAIDPAAPFMVNSRVAANRIRMSRRSSRNFCRASGRQVRGRME